jgi:hypothetical protein
VGKKHSKTSESTRFKSSPDNSGGSNERDTTGEHGERGKRGESSEQNPIDSIIFDLLGDKPVEAPAVGDATAKSATTGEGASQVLVVKGATAKNKAAKDTSAEDSARPVPDFDAELEAVIAAAFEGLPVRNQSHTEGSESDGEAVAAALAVLEATITTSGTEATALFPEKGNDSSGQKTQTPAVSPSDSAARDSATRDSVERDFAESDESAPAPFFEPIRKRHIWPLFICAVIIFIILTGGLTYANRLVIANQTEARAAIQREASGYLDESIALIQEADIVVIALDRATESQVREEDVPQLEALLEQVDDTQASLDKAIETAKRAQETFLEESGQELAQHAQEAAEYRKQMLELSSQLTNYDVAAMKSALSLEYAWSLIVDADADMRSAVEVVAGGGANSVEESRDYNQQAFDKLTLAEEMLTATVTAFPTVDIQSLRDYLAVKKASAELALASDSAFLEGDYYTASIRNEEFIEQDAEAVRLAAIIPSDPLSVVVAAYEDAVGQLRENYKEVRSSAADADAYLRAYLGVDVQQDSELPENNSS